MSPSSRLLGWLTALCLAALSLGLARLYGWPAPASALLGAGLALVGLALGDAIALKRSASPALSRLPVSALQLQRDSQMRLRLHNPGPRELRGSLFDHLPEALGARGLPLSCRLPCGEGLEVSYPLRPTQRGEYHLERCEWLQRSPLGLWRQRRLLAAAGRLQVFPDFTRLAAPPPTGQTQPAAGLRERPRPGDGLEFLQLREAHDEDNAQRIDWKSSARLGRPMLREYQQEGGQQVLLLLERGRGMAQQDGALTLFDGALQMALQLANTALGMGDAVGLQCFPEDRWKLSMARGPRQLQRLLHGLRDLQPASQASDYAELARILATHRRPCLVVVIGFPGEFDLESLRQLSRGLPGRHRLRLLCLRERETSRLCRDPVTSEEEALVYAGAVLHEHARQRNLSALRAAGVRVIEGSDGLDAMSVQRLIARPK